MSKQVGIIVGIILVALIGAGVFGIMQMKKNPTPNTTNTTSSAGNESIKSSIQGLLTSGQSKTCKISYPDQAGSGTVYVTDKRMRTDFSMKDAKNMDMTSHMIIDETYAYIWTDSAPQGTKIKIETFKQVPGQSTQAADITKQVDMQCSPWTVDNSKITVPSNIQFTDLSTAVKGAQTTTTPINNIQSSCAQMTDPAAKAVCQKAVGY